MYLEMEYYKHGSLRNWMETTKPDAVKKRAVLRQVLLALACVHNQGIVHSDIKGEVRVHQSMACLLSFTAHLFRCSSIRIDHFRAWRCSVAECADRG